MPQDSGCEMRVEFGREPVRVIDMRDMQGAGNLRHDNGQRILPGALAAAQYQRDARFAAGVLHHVRQPSGDILENLRIVRANYFLDMLHDPPARCFRVRFGGPSSPQV